MAMPSYVPLVASERMLLSSFDMPPDLDTYATEPARYSLDERMLSIMPPVLPMRKQPGLMPPTVAGPMICEISAGPSAPTDHDALGLGGVKDLASVALRHALGDERDRLELRELERLERRLVDRARRGEVDERVGVRVLLDRLGDRSVDRQQRLLGAPVCARQPDRSAPRTHRTSGRSDRQRRRSSRRPTGSCVRS